MIFCHDKREYMTLGEYMEKYPIAYAEAVESMTAEQKALFAARFEDRYIYLPKDETSDTGENFTISANVTFVTPNADNPESIPAGGTAYWKYTVDGDAENPVITVTGCEWVAPAEGMIFLFNPNGNITITVTASLKYYTITTNGENCSFSPSTGKIQARGSQQVFIHPATNYKWNGTLTVTGATAIKNVSGSYITLVNPTGDVTVSATCDRIVYPLTVSGINCTPNPKPTQIAAGGMLAITYTASSGYDLPTESGIGVVGCSYAWKQSTGVLTLYNPTGAVSAGVVAVARQYSITAAVTNGTATGANVIHTGETVALTISADSGYNLPDTVTVTGASQSWNKETGTLTLSNPTGAVTVEAVCAADTFTLEAGTYKWVDVPTTPNSLSGKSVDISFAFKDNEGAIYNSTAMKFLVSVDGFIEMKYHYSYDGEYIDDLICTFDEQPIEWYLDDRFITLSTAQTVTADFYNWAIAGGNLVKQEGETWVFNNIVYAGIETINIDFMSNNTKYTSISYGEEHVSSPYGLAYNTTCVFYHEDRIWANEAYRTITFFQPVTDATLLEWLQANGTKQ